MTDLATPNLPSRDFDATEAFYARLGFVRRYRSDYWMILDKGSLMLEFFPFPGLEPYQSDFSCCLRLDDMPAMVEACRAAHVPVSHEGVPRIVPPRREESGLDIAYLVDEDGSLLRLIQHPAA